MGEESSWERLYRASETVPWDTGAPQPGIVAAAEEGHVTGRVLDVGCGMGTESIYLAEQGHGTVGIDRAATAIHTARTRAARAGLAEPPEFRVGDVFTLAGRLEPSFDTVIDVGLFHAIEIERRAEYAATIASFLREGGRVLVLAFGPGAPTDWPPTPIKAADITRTFTAGWEVAWTTDAYPFVTRSGAVGGILARIDRETRADGP